ncbi:MAG: T9SS type A sorting domain-containing protein [Crocinitomicaceae bacterium]|nr:T9SS type A sorting domain-containing protein [Crocinitomicaceae bacterium]
MKIIGSILFVFCLLTANGVMSQQYGQHSHSPQLLDERAAGCAPASSSAFLEYNNVKALLHSGGNMWQIAGQNLSHYEVPKGSGIMALFTSALWLGGVDINGQLKLAAVRYRDGQDYWTGPLTEGGDAEIIPETCVKYDRHFEISQDEVREFDGWYTAGLLDAQNGTHTQAEDFPDYVIPQSILEWPAHGDPTLGQDFYLAPFYDRNEDGLYNPLDGDYPWYDIEKELDCSVDRTVTLYGDKTIWWVMNDKGNIHTETGGDPLGMEIRCQAFAFATNDEINNMTFYNYELVNRSTQTLFDTYFGIFIDAALGNPFDDYVGCDVSRGLAYCYNGNAVDSDNGGWKGYGTTPPSAGIDFFEGPYKDNDGVDNPLVVDYTQATSQGGIPYPGLGIGFGDGIIDNERIGMHRFLYYNNLGGGGSAQTDPQTAQDYYNYLTGYWKDGTHFVYGGNGHPGDPNANASVEANYMFPGDTDPIGWGTDGYPQPLWTEQTAGNFPYDRRFAQSAGPFVLKPGAVNNITYGILWARASSGGPFESVIELQKADDKAQALFDNCFKVLDGPHAPELSIQEMENEIIISIYNPTTSNNANEDYAELDPFILNVDNDPNFDNYYRFQGYQVYQLLNDDVSSTDLGDLSLARLVFQCDVKDTISKLVNYTYDSDMGASIPTVMVDGNNEGIRHSFNVTEDLFATGDRTLVNFKTYYYMVIAYASNQFKKYDPTDPLYLNGQKIPYLASRKASIGEIKVYEAMPHHPASENGGTIFSVPYGYELPVTRIDGWGNGGLWTNITPESEAEILENNQVNELSYTTGAGPVKITVIDPLNLPAADFELYFQHDASGDLDSANWYIIQSGTTDTIHSDHPIHFANEQIIPEWGISVSIEQIAYEDGNMSYMNWKTKPIDARIEFADSSKRWLMGVPDDDQYYPTNWIRSGTYIPQDDECIGGELYNPCYYKDKNLDADENYEKLLGGTVAPFKLVGSEFIGMPLGYPDVSYDTEVNPTSWFTPAVAQNQTSFADVHGVDIVITADKSKWTRCPVIETCHVSGQAYGGSSICKLRYSNSVDQNGNQESGTGMGWFPGYAIDVETGQRLNMAFGENSWLNGSNGEDMMWNPTDEFFDNIGEPLFGGSHAIYVFGVDVGGSDMPVYDEGEWLYAQLQNETASSYIKAWKNCQWIMMPIVMPGHDLLETDVRISLRVEHPYQEKNFTGINDGLPAYRFSTNGLQTLTDQNQTAIESLSRIKVVPNPYYAYSSYEKSGVENRVRITNLPEVCAITIFNMSGQLVKRFDKDNELSFIDWNLVNHVGIPIASGVYLIHVNVPGVGETIIKWYGAMRQLDIHNL